MQIWKCEYLPGMIATHVLLIHLIVTNFDNIVCVLQKKSAKLIYTYQLKNNAFFSFFGVP